MWTFLFTSQGVISLEWYVMELCPTVSSWYYFHIMYKFWRGFLTLLCVFTPCCVQHSSVHCILRWWMLSCCWTLLDSYLQIRYLNSFCHSFQRIQLFRLCLQSVHEGFALLYQPYQTTSKEKKTALGKPKSGNLHEQVSCGDSWSSGLCWRRLVVSPLWDFNHFSKSCTGDTLGDIKEKNEGMVCKTFADLCWWQWDKFKQLTLQRKTGSAQQSFFILIVMWKCTDIHFFLYSYSAVTQNLIFNNERGQNNRHKTLQYNRKCIINTSVLEQNKSQKHRCANVACVHLVFKEVYKNL